MTAIALVAEANGSIGAGHVGELRAVGAALERRGVPTNRIAVGDRSFTEEGLEWIGSFEALAPRLSQIGAICWSVRTDAWRMAWPQIERLRAHHVWIADIAADVPRVDILIVPSMDTKWSEAAPARRVLSGTRYFPLDVRGEHGVKRIEDRGRDVLLTLGGADRTQASLRIAPQLAGTKSTVVIGPMFRHRDALERIASAAGLASVIAPAGLRDLLLDHRLVISAGGNTLFEAAAAGTPALVAWEDPHERDQGEAFARHGIARVAGRGTDVEAGAIVRSMLASPAELQRMSGAARNLIDGKGADRIAAVLLEEAAGAAA